MKYVEYYEEECGTKVILNLTDTIGAIEAYFQESSSGDECHLKIIEMSEEEYNALPESFGC